MGIFDLFKPNVDKLERKRNVEGLIKALQYEKMRKFERVQHVLLER